MLLEMASSEGRGSLRGISRHGGSQGRSMQSHSQLARVGGCEAPVERVPGKGSLRLQRH